MAKLLKDQLEIRLDLNRANGQVTVACSAHYEVNANEYGMSERRGLPIKLTPQQEQAVKGFTAQVVAQIKQHEGV